MEGKTGTLNDLVMDTRFDPVDNPLPKEETWEFPSELYVDLSVKRSYLTPDHFKLREEGDSLAHLIAQTICGDNYTEAWFWEDRIAQVREYLADASQEFTRHDSDILHNTCAFLDYVTTDGYLGRKGNEQKKEDAINLKEEIQGLLSPPSPRSKEYHVKDHLYEVLTPRPEQTIHYTDGTLPEWRENLVDYLGEL